MASMIQKIQDTLHMGGGGDPRKAEEKRRAAEAAKVERQHGQGGGGGGIGAKIKKMIYGGGEGERYGEKKHGQSSG